MEGSRAIDVCPWRNQNRSFGKHSCLGAKVLLLVPGVGAQGGDLASVFHAAANEDVGLLVNSSRSIIFASSGDDYADAARMAAMDLQQQMKKLL